MSTPTIPPVLYVFAGPNGAGKSTLFSLLKEEDWLRTVEQVNGDVIYKESPWLTQDELAVIVGERIKSRFEANQSFSIETNLATSASYNVLQSAHKKGYQVALFYVSLESSQLCRDRVKDRVSRGGHDVPFAIIEHRYKNALSLIKQRYSLFDKIDFIDNSAGDFRSVLQVESSELTYQYDPLPDWAAGIVKHINLMEKVWLKTKS